MQKTFELYDRVFAIIGRGKPIVSLLSRITLGLIFVPSGWGKLHNLEKVTEYFTSLGVPAANLQAPFVASVELVCGALVLVGLLTRLAAIPLMFTMVVAIATAKKGDISDFTDIFGIAEYLYIVLFLYLITDGPGPLSLDHLLRRRR